MQNRMSYSAIEGTLYLKQAYQKNMVIALTVGVMLHLVALGTYVILTQSPLPLTTEVFRPPPDWSVYEVPLPPSFDDGPPMEKVEYPESAIPKIGIPEAVADFEAGESIAMATREQRYELVRSGGETGGRPAGDFSAFARSVEKDIAPPIDSFVIYDSDPEAIYLAMPDYPELARRAGFEGTVVVRVLIDRDGNVRDARIRKSSGTNVGFEQSAIDAAMNSKFTPALQNDHPVMCWYSYTIVFSLH